MLENETTYTSTSYREEYNKYLDTCTYDAGSDFGSMSDYDYGLNLSELLNLATC